MSEYVERAKDFLKKCNAKMEIEYIGRDVNKDWDEYEERDKYRFTIITPLGKMEGTFWNSFYATEHGERPTEYDILACLETSDVGTIDDFVEAYGYEVKNWSDVKRIERTYKAVVKEYSDLCRIFTPEQMDMLDEIK